MSKIAIFMADGCEEIEGLTVVDIARRAGIEIDMISISDSKTVTSSHKVTFLTDLTKEEADFSNYDGIVLPGGLPGTLNLGADETVNSVIKEFAAQGKMVAAVCAAPSVLGEAGLLQGKKATCYPGYEDKLLGAQWIEEQVAVDGNIITSRGLGTTIPFALEIVKYLIDEKKSKEISDKIIFTPKQ
ncbi:MAG: DJ-1 family glyoxalase III [Agathobacter sp.]|nr:DJ-1 family glyoxalase III [Agathobacter sp.]